MLRAKRLHEWDQTGELVSIMANANRDVRKRRRPFRKSECVPPDLAKEFRLPRGIRLSKSALHSLKPLFQKKDR
jgi:hypothetical protein